MPPLMSVKLEVPETTAEKLKMILTDLDLQYEIVEGATGPGIFMFLVSSKDVNPMKFYRLGAAAMEAKIFHPFFSVKDY